MLAGWETYFERLGPQGLRLVLAGLLGPEEVTRLTGRATLDLSLPDRAQSVADLLAEDPSQTGPVLELLDRAAAPAEASPDEWEEKQLRERIAGLLRAPDISAARLLHGLARLVRPPLPAAEIRAAAEVVAMAVLGEESGSRPKWVAKVASDRAGMRELEHERRELEGRVRQLETQLARTLENSASLEEQLAARLEELRDLKLSEKALREDRQRLERESTTLQRRIEDLNERRARERTGEVTTHLRRLTTEQRRAGARLEKLRLADRERRKALADQAQRLEKLADLVEKIAGLQEVESRASSTAQETIHRELALLRTGLGGGRLSGGPETRTGGSGLPRAGIFVDVQNMFYGARERGARLDFEALLAQASEGRHLVRAVAYVVETREIDQSGFIHLLQMKAYEVKRKPLRIRPDRTMKGNWDLEMALDALATADHLDIVVLVTGDGDFLPLVRQVKLKGCEVEVYGFPKSTAPDLREAADRFVAIPRRLLRPLDPERRRPRPVTAAPESAGENGKAGQDAPEEQPVPAS